MKIGRYFSLPTKNLLATLASGSVAQNWLAHLESSVSWIHSYSHNQEQCIQGLLKSKPKLCREPLYGDYLNVVTQSNPSVNKEPDILERAKRPTLKNRWHSPKTVVQNSPKTNSAKFQAKNFTNFSSGSSSKPKASKMTYLPKSLKPEVPVNKLQKWTAEQNFQDTLTEPKKQYHYFASKHQKAESGSFNSKHKYSKKKSRLQLKDTINTGNNWFQDISYRVSNTLHKNNQKKTDPRLSTDKSKYSPSDFADNDISQPVQAVTHGKRSSYELLADQSGLFESITTVSSSTYIEASEDGNTYQPSESPKGKYPPFDFADSNISQPVQVITYGKRSSYELLADQSGLFENITTVSSSTHANREASEDGNTYQYSESSIPQPSIDKSTSKEQAFYQNLNNDLKQQPIIPTQTSTRVQGHQDILSDAPDLPQPVLQHDKDSEQLLSRLIATEEKSTSAPLPTKTEQQSIRRENQVTATNHQQAQPTDVDLPELASRVKRILDEQARRHGIDV